MPQALAFFRGDFVPVAEANVSIMTHALHYGTAVFEGIRGNWNEEQGKIYIFRAREHYQRLLQGCRIMLMDIPYSVDDLLEITEDLIRRCGYREDLYIRPIVYKSEELVANLRLQDLSSDFALMTVPFGAYIEAEGAIRCCTSSWRRIDDTIIPPRVKISGHYINSILAKTEATLGGLRRSHLHEPGRKRLRRLRREPVHGRRRCHLHSAGGGEQPHGDHSGTRRGSSPETSWRWRSSRGGSGAASCTWPTRSF